METPKCATEDYRGDNDHDDDRNMSKDSDMFALYLFYIHFCLSVNFSVFICVGLYLP